MSQRKVWVDEVEGSESIEITQIFKQLVWNQSIELLHLHLQQVNITPHRNENQALTQQLLTQHLLTQQWLQSKEYSLNLKRAYSLHILLMST